MDNLIYLSSQTTVILLSLRGTIAIWDRWMSEDVASKREYYTMINAASKNILKDVTDGSITPADGMEKAYTARNTAMHQTRQKTNPTGLLIARFVKAAEGLSSYYLDKKRTHKI
ncbi:hypothetical protein F5884DRAFT_879937 [Xylogone sp. PMI_703]|nr:hypothetical protein F5884DRAFT_879937 [Xylogone sp. PMI_703]